MSGGGEERRVGKRAEQKRRWDRAHPAVCVDCGAKCGTHPQPTRRPEPRCITCATKLRRWKRDEAARLYNLGLPIKEIGEQLGVTNIGPTLVYARREGLIGYRYNIEGGQRAGR